MTRYQVQYSNIFIVLLHVHCPATVQGLQFKWTVDMDLFRSRYALDLGVGAYEVKLHGQGLVAHFV